MLLSAGDSTDPSGTGGSATIAAGTASASSAHSYIQIMGTDANGAGGDVDIVSTGIILIQAPLQVTGYSTLASTQAASLEVLGSSTLGTTQAASLQVSGSSTLGSAQVASLQVSGSSTLGSTQAASLQVRGSTTLDSTQAASMRVLGSSILASTQAASLQVSGSSILSDTQAASLQVLSSSTIGTTASDTLTVNAVARFTAGSTLLYGSSGVLATSAILGFQRSLGTSAVSTGTVLGQVQFTGWDGAVDGLGAQIRSVFTVS